MNRAKRLAAGAALAGLLAVSAGCAGKGGVEASTVLAYDQCQGLDMGLTRVSYADVAGIRGGTLLNLSEPESSTPAAEGLLLVAISRGRQPTPGYALSLAGARRQDDTAIVEVHWDTPEPGAVLAQMMTHPCLVVALPKDDFRRVEAVDQSGRSLGSLDL